MRHWRRVGVCILTVLCIVYLLTKVGHKLTKAITKESAPSYRVTPEINGLRPYNQSDSNKQPTEIQAPSLLQNGSASTKLQTRTGAVDHYRSLLDDQPVTLHCASCALVSSSGFLLGKEAGQDIDKHPCVIRMNMAPVEGYEKDVGTRTTLRVLNFFTGVKASKLPPGSRVMIWGLYEHKADLKRVLGMLKNLRPNVIIHGQTVEGERKAGELFTKETGHPLKTNDSWLSTGWFTMMIALDLCDKLHVYGMVPAEYCVNKPKVDFPYHYYKSTSSKECATYNVSETRRGAHRFITEKAVFARWAARYNITFHYPEWTIQRDKLSDELDTPFVNKYKLNSKSLAKKA
ncbi:alpha-N-acetylgalactosaminide alpha-2,6-sialyltransferase 6-like [Acanthaster planci]|uniref:Alpha-N-acetylgalactosaminide alpha-2,6-sialyltransferase 6-like n=1 Tax=Acanthaster planci TaxID=133434 RepID=A0A8B7Y6W2_ACAPL|nr:alpha-N-acetylgalactosaminide alpha-2,6-sialyltransferase 6-like [Acanthaster planci]